MSSGFLLLRRDTRRRPPAPIPSEMEVKFEIPGWQAWARPGVRALSLGEHGMIFGCLFHRHGPAKPIAALEAADIQEIARSRGASLLSGFWGGYVAAIVDGNRVTVLRDPSGAQPCYLSRVGGISGAASDVDLLLGRSPISASIDWEALAAHLYGAGLPTARTVLTNVEELLPGYQIELGVPGARQRQCWTPWDHVGIEGRDDADKVERLERTIRHSVQSWAAQFDRILLSVSGGLDSSIIAACFAAPGGPQVQCLTMYGDDAGGDERIHARALCGFLNLPLAECRYRVEDVDIDAPLGAHLPRPFGRTQSNAYERAHIAHLEQVHADAFFTGNGGDNVFAYSQSAAAIADRLLVERLTGGSLASLRDVCRQTGCTIFQAIAATVRTLRGPRLYAWLPSSSFLHPSVLAHLSGDDLKHDWLAAPPGSLPGKAAHIAGLLRVQPNLEPGRSRVAPVINPLLSQPIVEACLRIPSWRWRQGGIDRAAARDAFRNDLPASIITRRSKGGPDAFTAQLIARYRPQIRERLLEGNLAAHRIVDKVAIERVLGDTRPTLGEERTRLLALLSTEAWLRYWRERLGSRQDPA